MSKKYIIEIEDTPVTKDGVELWKACGFNSLVFDEEGLKRLTKQPDGEYISRQSVTESDLIDWYINSVDESEPVWTEEHIHELFNDFYLIPKED